MGKLGGVLGTFVGIGILMIGMRDAWDEVFNVMNTTTTLSTFESIVWQLAPIAIPVGAVVGGIIVLTRRSGPRDNDTTEW